MTSYDDWLTTPPDENWGVCPECKCSQEDAEHVDDPDVYLCDCGRWYADEDAHPDASDMREDARLSEAGL